MNASRRHARSLLIRLAVYIPLALAVLGLMPSFRAGLARVVNAYSFVFVIAAVSAIAFLSYLQIQDYRTTRRTWDLVEVLVVPALVAMSVVMVLVAKSLVQ